MTERKENLAENPEQQLRDTMEQFKQELERMEANLQKLMEKAPEEKEHDA